MTGRAIPIVVASAVCLVGGCHRPAAQTAHSAQSAWSVPESQAAQEADGRMVSVPANDWEVNGAIAEARRTLPVFWAVFDHRPANVDSYALKIDFPVNGGGGEYIWIDVISHRGSTIDGEIDDDPVNRPDLKFGTRVRASQTDVADWAYRKGGKLFGHFTTRVLVKHLKPLQASETLQLLSPTPLEPGAS